MAGSRSRRRTVAALAAVVVVACGATAGSAWAGDGDLFVDSCLGRVATPDCGTVDVPGHPVGLAVSPDGRQVYVGLQDAGGATFSGLQIYDRSPTGVLSRRPGVDGCFVATNVNNGCTQVGGPNNPDYVWDVAVSPDGFSVFAVANGTGSLLNFYRDPATGALAYLGCVGAGAGCTPLRGGISAQSVAVSPNSRTVYVRGPNRMAVLDRIPGSLALEQKSSFAGCLSHVPVAECSRVDGLAGNGYKVVVAPDGNQVYTTFESPGGVAVFNRDSAGTLRQITPGGGPAGGCVSANGLSGGDNPGCVDGNDGLATAWSVAISPDGGAVYVGSAGGVTAYSRTGGNGLLTQTACFGGAGCTAVGAGISSVFDLAVTPDGGDLIAASYGAESIVSFVRSASGELSVRTGSRGCITRVGGACVPLTLLRNVDGWLTRVAMDPTSPRFFVAGRLGVLATVTRDFAPTCVSRNVDAPFNTAVSVPLTCSDANGDLIALEKGVLPAKGQLGEIENNAVFYSPFANFTGADSFTFRASVPSRGVAGPYATVNVGVAGPTATTPQPGGIDSDRDGFFAGQDCNDANAAIRPGAQEIRGNRTDENCDGTADPFPTVASGVVSKWDVKGSRLTLETLQVTQQFPRGWKARITCRGKPKCTFASKTLKAGKVRRGAATIISSLSKRQRVFRAGQTVEIWVTAPDFNTKVARLVLKRNRIPGTEPFCVLPGSSLVQKTCT